jgi:hypothetical protein
LHEPLNKPHFSLTNADIDGSIPRATEFATKRVGHNPLNPVYSLPKVEMRPFTPPKFVRDAHSVHDIEGTKPDPGIRSKTRDHHNVHDIDGARPKPETFLEKPNLMDPTDINKGEMFVSKRTTNPL